ncbi:MAG TPA: four helix bundle protein [Bacteroidales bacterium]
MPENKPYTELEVWKKSRELVKDIYVMALEFPKEEIYSLTSQIRRAVISIPSNIAKGVARNHDKETHQFLYIARGSMYEVETQVYLADDLDYIDKNQLEVKLRKIEACRKLFQGFINYYKNKIT